MKKNKNYNLCDLDIIPEVCYEETEPSNEKIYKYVPLRLIITRNSINGKCFVKTEKLK
ncbi:hypothetical protein [uncultured Eubacterium sp.]|uniref:hypothetical protein n=1 Tax=uncultured Eubacterium sp. TaxID=165185 RepID=UPI0025916D6B|nr:hypothetical protein [uncultured Eubacterium sp.]